MEEVRRLRVLHDEIDRKAGELEKIHRQRLQCKNTCNDCCVDEITVFEIEAERIRADFAELLAQDEPYPEGKCAFLDTQGSCRIYAARPYVCRTQGLPLRWTEDEYEYRDICVLNEEGPPLVDLSSEDCWTLGHYEAQLAMAQKDGKRVSLRSLFKSADK